MTQLAERIASLSPQERAKLAQRLKARNTQPSERIPVLSRESTTFPLSFTQQRLWFLDQLDPGNPFYNIPSAFRLTGRLNVAQLAQTLRELASRHEALRTSFRLDPSGESDQPVQIIAPTVEIPLPLVDLRSVPAAERQAEAERVLREEALHSFDLSIAPLWRALLVQTAEREHILLLTMHHTIFDGWSLGLFMREMAAIYTALVEERPAALPTPSLQYADFAHWQRQWFQGEIKEQQLNYWRQHLGGELPILDLPTDHPRPPVQSYRGALHAVLLPWTLYTALKELSRQHEATLFMSLLAAFKTLLYRYTGQQDMIVGFPLSGRNWPEVQGLIGPFVNTLALRTDLSGDPDFISVLQQVRTVTLGAFANQDVPFDMLVETLQPGRSLGYNPLFQVMFTYQNAVSTTELTDLTLTFLPLDGGTAKFDLSLDVYEGPDGPTCVFEYSTDLFDHDRIVRMAAHFQTLLEGIVANPHQPISELPLLTSGERAQIIETWNSTNTAYPLEQTIVEAFVAQVQRTPNAIAVTDSREAITYTELNQRAGRIARRLIELGVGPDVIVPILMERSAAFLTAMLAIFKAGGAYLPLDPHHPPARIAQVLRESAASQLLITQSMVPLVTEVLASGDFETPPQLIVIEPLLGSAVPAYAGPTRASPRHLAYVLFTSGSTGTPKGVMIEHAGMLNHLWVMNDTLGLQADAVVAQTASQCFDISVWQFLSVLLLGGRVHIVNEEATRDPSQLIDTIATQQISILEIVPSLLGTMLDELKSSGNTAALNSLRWLIPTGEEVTPELCRRWLSLYPNTPLLNAYGPAECADDVTLQRIAVAPDASVRYVPIGQPVANMQTYILDSYQQPVPVGICGELYIGGVGVGRGYLNRPDLTAERFIPNLFTQAAGLPTTASDRLYKTGDLARYERDGTIVFLGRADYQVKVRGFRIELGEIEAQLRRHPAVETAVVMAWEDSSGAKQLVAYVAADPKFVSRTMLTSYLEERLPEYMVPTTLMVLPSLPLTPNGKIDRRALPRPERRAAEGSFIGPRNRTEELLTELWCQAFNTHFIGIYDDFFRLGGHSILAIQLMTQVRRVFQVDLPLRSLFQAPTIAGLAAVIAEQQGAQATHQETIDSVPNFPPDPAHWHDPFPLTDVQQAYWVGRHGAFELGNVSTHNYDELEFTSLNLDHFNRAWQRLVARHGMLRAIVHPDGQQQILANVPPYTIKVLDLRDKSEAEAEAELATFRQMMSHQVLRTDQWPVFDLRISLLPAGRSRVHFSTDSLTFDAWSFVVLLRELIVLHENPDAPLPELEVSFRDYVLAEQALKNSPQYKRSYDYWHKQIPSLPPAPQLPLVKNPSTIERPHFTRLHATLDRERWSQLKAKATRIGLTPTGILLAAYAEVLSSWSKSPQFTLNLTFLNRLPIHPQVNDIVGEFTSLTLLAVDNTTIEPFTQRAQRTQERLWSDLEHYHLSGIQVLRELKRQQGGVTSAKMPIVFTSALTLPIPDTADETLSLKPVHSITQTSQVYLDCGVWEDSGMLLCNWDVVEELFPPNFLQEMFGVFWQLVSRLAEEDAIWQQTTLVQPPPAQIAQREQINATQAAISLALMHNLFENQVARTPTQLAVISPTRRLSYAEVEQRANQIGRQLRSLGARPNTLVAVVMEKGWEQVVATLAVLKAGAAYLPIDPELPRERISYLLKHGDVAFVLTQTRVAAHISWPEGIETLLVDSNEWSLLDDTPLTPVQQPDDLAYVIFTSGSTGLPKGVMIDHRGAVNTILDCNQRFAVGSRDRVLAISALNFDLSVYDIFGILAVGGTVVMPNAADRRDPAHWFELVEREQVTVWNSVPALLDLLTDYAERTNQRLPASLRLAMLSGDWIPLALPNRVRAISDQIDLYSLGGATEASIWSILYHIETVDPSWQSIPYGVPMVNQTFHVLNHALEPCPVWVLGMLYIGGIGLAQGYWRDAEKTNGSFIIHPRTGQRLYRTGDTGRYLPDGTIEFLGREDFQVKIQGHRIELGEIEAALVQHPLVQNAVVTVVGESRGSKRLVAYVVPRSTQPIEAHELRRFLRSKLPEYMVPTVVHTLETLPLTANGKVNRGALAALQPVEGEATRQFVEPSTPIEQSIAQIWAELLGIEKIGATDNFFEIGGDSLLAVRCVARIGMRCGVEIPLRNFFEHPVITQLAEYISTAQQRSS